MPEDITKVLGWGVDLPTFEKRTYRLAEPTQAIKAEYIGYLRRIAMEHSIEASRDLPDDMKDDLRRLTLRDLSNYYWGSTSWSESLKHQPSITFLICLLLQRGEDTKPQARRNNISEELTQRMMQSKEIGPYLWGALYMLSGMDPTMALQAGMLTLTSAEQTTIAAEKQLISIMNELRKI